MVRRINADAAISGRYFPGLGRFLVLMDMDRAGAHRERAAVWRVFDRIADQVSKERVNYLALPY
jgi:hypothetical protein